ncbi:MAG: hypothetical protein GYB31_05610 [Bacteroidetes bacterium]|nr:hypothetical protein [Bacteroidota bacterium]
MPLFQIQKENILPVRLSDFSSEKMLQNLVEKNLATIFNCRFVATEYSTGAIHGGRIDSLALSEDNNPVIIEYKIKASSDLINQSLFYLSWLQDHKGDFQLAVHQALGNEIEVDWSDIRVICIAPEFKKYDLHAVKMMGANIELWQYRLYSNKAFHLEEVFQRSSAILEVGNTTNTKQKPAYTRQNVTYSLDEDHLQDKSDSIQSMVQKIRNYILSIDESIEEIPKKLYVAYRTSQNFVCMEIQKKKIYLFLKIEENMLNDLPSNGRDVTNIGHFGTGNVELTIQTDDDIDAAQSWILQSWRNIGG